MPSEQSPPPFPFIEISGTPHERGLQYGQKAGDRIAIGLDIYREAFETAGITWKQAMAFSGKFARRIEQFDNDMWQEIKGISIGAQQSVESIVALNARTEIIFWRDNELHGNGNGAADLSSSYADECTAAAALPSVTANGHMIHGQNWDWNPRCAESSIVLRIENETGPNMLTFVEAGQLARHGMNSEGIALTVNGLQCNIDGGRIGIANPLIRRRMLLSHNLAGAIDVAMNTPTSFSHNLIISHRGGAAINIETTPEARYWLQPEQGVIVHANHFKCPIARGVIQDIGVLRCPESLYRDQRLLNHMNAHIGKISVDTFMEGFADTFGSPDAILRTPKARPGGNLSGTVASIIMDTTAGVMYVAPSPYISAHYAEYRINP